MSLSLARTWTIFWKGEKNLGKLPKLCVTLVKMGSANQKRCILCTVPWTKMINVKLRRIMNLCRLEALMPLSMNIGTISIMPHAPMDTVVRKLMEKIVHIA